jgi:hypothetical protein
MNNERRKKLQTILNQLDGLKSELENVGSDESEYYDNIPENLQSSERAEQSDECKSSIESAVDNLQSAIDEIQNAIDR